MLSWWKWQWGSMGQLPIFPPGLRKYDVIDWISAVSLVSQNVYLWIWSRAQTAFSGFSSFSSSLIELQTPSKAVLSQVPEHPSLPCRYSTLARATLLYSVIESNTAYNTISNHSVNTLVILHWWYSSLRRAILHCNTRFPMPQYRTNHNVAASHVTQHF